jgi:alpha-L-fucosidase 2
VRAPRPWLPQVAAGPLGTKGAIFHQVVEADPAKRLTGVTLTAASGTAPDAHLRASLENAN